jgi:hypothetical protein
VVRSAMKRIPETEGLDWVQGHLLASIDPVLDQPWILVNSIRLDRPRDPR